VHEASNFGMSGALKALLLGKGDPNAEDSHGNTPLHFAAYSGHASVAKLLVASKANVNRCNTDNETALKAAEDGNKKEVADILRAVSGR